MIKTSATPLSKPMRHERLHGVIAAHTRLRMLQPYTRSRILMRRTLPRDFPPHISDAIVDALVARAKLLSSRNR